MGDREVLQSWKEIAAYLGRDVRTCRRWEENLGLPVHRLDGSPKARVMAYKDEVDWWLDAKLHEHDAEKSPSSPAMKILGARVRPSLAPLRRWYAMAGFTVFMAVGVLGWRIIHPPAPRYVPDGSLPTIVVLPFVNTTGDDGLNYLSEAIPDHLIRDLQRSAESLKIFSFDAVIEAVRKLGLDPGAPLTPEECMAVSDRLGARWYIAGYLSGTGVKVRLNYAIRRAGDTAALKEDRVQGTEGEMRTVEGRVASSVRRAFEVPTPAGPEVSAQCSIQATRLLEAARAVARKYTVNPVPETLEKIIGLFDQARQIDPGCPLAYLGLGDAYQYRFVYEDKSPDVLKLMEESYRRAYEIAPERAETNVGLAWVYYFERDNDQAYAHFKRALALDPSSLHVLTDVGGFLRSVGMLERAAEYYTRVIQAGGTTGDLFLLRGYTYEQMGLFESALSDYERMIELDPTDVNARLHRTRVLMLMGRSAAAAEELALAETMAPGDRYVGLVRALAAAAAGDRKAALAGIEASRDPSRPSRGTYFRSRIFAALGMLDEAVATIQSGIERGFDDIYDYLYFFPYLNNTRDHFYDNLRSDPRYAEILRAEEHKYAENLKKYHGL
jgi:tetratricopeptide (TPR) repeat protein/TolB-like protein